MPRSFLVKKHQSTKKPNYGSLKSKIEEAPCSTHEDSLLHNGIPPHHHRAALSPRLQQTAQSLSSSSTSASSPNTSALSFLEVSGRCLAEPSKPADSCTQVNLEIHCVTRNHRRKESILPPCLPLMTVFPAVPPCDSSQESFECLDYHKKYLIFGSLAKHKCVWSSKKYFSCKYCEKEYVSLGALKMHIRTHTLPCVCKICGKAFSRPWLLQGHIRTHTGEKPFSCLHCNRAFADRSNLRAHLQTHSEVKKYRCANCFKTFSRISLLAKHQEGGCQLS